MISRRTEGNFVLLFPWGTPVEAANSSDWKRISPKSLKYRITAPMIVPKCAKATNVSVLNPVELSPNKLNRTCRWAELETGIYTDSCCNNAFDLFRGKIYRRQRVPSKNGASLYTRNDCINPAFSFQVLQFRQWKCLEIIIISRTEVWASWFELGHSSWYFILLLSGLGVSVWRIL